MAPELPWYRPFVVAMEREARTRRTRTKLALVMFAAGLTCGLVLAVCWLPSLAVPR